MKTNISCVLLIALFLFAANACRQNSPDAGNATVTQSDVSTASGQAATATATDSNTATSKLDGGAAVPAKRENLTAADRAAFLRAVGLTEYADNSARFVEYMTGPTGFKSFKNAGMTFFDLGAGKYLVEIMTDQGARLSTSVYALYQESGSGEATAKKLELDSYYPKDGKIVKSTALEKVGAPRFDAPSKTLTIIAAARGYGGCGELTKYKIVGDRAETIEARYQECTDSDELLPPEKWAKLSINGETAETAPPVKLPVAKSPGISVCAEGYGGNGLEIKHADFARMQPAHAAVLQRWLCFQKANMRPARDEKNSLSSQKYFRQDRPSEDPFYAVGDFNKNGIPDFAVILDYFVPRIHPETKRGINALAIFEMSPETTGNQPEAAYFTDVMDALFIVGTFSESGTLWSGSYPSDDGIIFVPKGKTYTVEPMVDL